MASRNGSAVASTPLRLYATIGDNEAMPRVRYGTPLSKSQRDDLIKQNPARNTAALRCANKVVEICEHPFLDLIANPNRFRSQFEFFEETTIFNDLTGDSYWLMDFNALGMPVSLQVLPSQYTRIVPSKTKFIKGYLFGRDSLNRQAIPSKRVIHIRRPNPKDQYYGMGCLEASIVAANQYDSMDTYETALNKNKGIPSMVVTYQGNLSRDDIPKLEAEWNRSLRGMANSGKIKVTDQGYDIKQLSVTPREMAYMQGRKWSRNEIANAFDIPISMLETENVNKANAQAGNEQYARRAITPRLRRIEDRINHDLIPLYGEPRIFAAFDNPVPEDNEFELKRARDLWTAGIITRAQAQEMQKVPVDVAANQYYLPATGQAFGENTIEENTDDG
jgi:HK97 family phage portal protein